MASGKTTARKGKSKEDRTIEDSINRRSIEGDKHYGKGSTYAGVFHHGGVIGDMEHDGLWGDSTRPVNHRAGNKQEGKNLTRVGMARDNTGIAIRSDYDDGSEKITRQRGKNYTSMPSKPVGGAAKSAKKTTKQTTSKPTTSKTSTAKKDDLKKTTKRTTTTKKTTKKR